MYCSWRMWLKLSPVSVPYLGIAIYNWFIVVDPCSLASFSHAELSHNTVCRYASNMRWVQQLQVQLQEQSVQSMSSDIELSFMTNIARCSGESTSIRYTILGRRWAIVSSSRDRSEEEPANKNCAVCPSSGFHLILCFSYTIHTYAERMNSTLILFCMWM